MKWLIKNPAPIGRLNKKWGDYNFGLALAKSLEKLNHETETDYFGDWYNKKKTDVVLVLRGDYQYEEELGYFSILWIYSHPETVSIEECNQYDVVCVCSQIHADWLGKQVKKPIAIVPQCTDTNRFCLKNDHGEIGKDIIFVGNTRITRRNSVIWAIEAGISVKIWGKGWNEYVDSSFIVAEHIDNKQLAGLYSGSKATLNDHFPDMREWGYISNRVYDAIACGLPVISDYVPGLNEIFGDSVLCFRTKDEFFLCIEKLLLQYPAIKKITIENAKMVCEEHSFDNRAIMFDKLARQHK